MKQNNFYNKMKRQIKKFFKEIKNKNTSFFVLLLCICLISTAIIWKYSSNDNNEIAQNEENSPNSISTDKDPYKDYVDQTMEDYQKTLEAQDKKKQEEIKSIIESFEKPIDGTIAREFNINELIYYEAIEEWRTHQGIDIKPKSSLTVNSSYDGIVERVDTSGIMGVEIVINHGDEVSTIYGCLSSANVAIGDSVKKGDKLGTLGIVENIEMSEVPHLHYEIVVKGESYDPTQVYKD